MSLTKEEERRFFANKPNPPHRITMGGRRIALANFPVEEQKKILARLAEKDKVAAEGLKGVLPGIKIDGKSVTKDNIKDFEKTSKKSKKDIPKELTKKDLEKLSFKELKVIGKKFGVTDRSRIKLIKEILKAQS